MMWWGNNDSWGWPLFLVLALACMAMIASMMRHRTSRHTWQTNNAMRTRQSAFWPSG